MRTAFTVLAVLAFLAPIAAWVALTSAMCGHAARAGCGVGLGDFVDDEFVMIAALPWLLALAFGWLAWRLGRRRSGG